MLWFKMPKNLEQMGIDARDVGLVAEILYFANSKTGEINLCSRSLMTKYLKTSRDYYVIISKLCREQVVNKGSKKGQYFYNVNWDNENNLETKCEQVENKVKTTCNTLTIDKNRIDKKDILVANKIDDNAGVNESIEANKKTVKKNKKTGLTSDEEKLLIKEIIDYLNEKTDSKFTYTAQKTVSSIKARLSEKHDLNAFKYVIDVKCCEWLLNAKMNTFLRPETLFSSNFETYLQQKMPKQEKTIFDLLQNEKKENEFNTMSQQQYFNYVRDEQEREKQLYGN